MKLRSLSNQRPTADLGQKLIVAPTNGILRITPMVSSMMKISSGDYIKVVEDVNSNTFYLTQGSYSEDNGPDGNKLASPKGTGTLNFSSANIWQDLKGDENSNVHYTVGEAVDFEGMSLYPLEYEKTTPKQIRKKSGADVEVEEGEEEVEEVEEGNVNPIQEEATDGFDGFDSI